ncbi:MAG: thioredoxin family protein [Lewinella sp.]|nr:thioredoxin family protein [Lewinella sp.]
MKKQPTFRPFNLILLLLASFSLWYCQSTGQLNNETIPMNQEIISHEGEPILVGQLNREAWQMEAYQDWFAAEYADYTVDEATVAGLQPHIGNLEVKVFLGTWCSDSQREVPHLYKVLDALDFDETHLQVVALDNHPDRRKTSPQHEEAGWNIEYVPTIIFLRNGTEIGRIVEMPEVSLERDLAVILAREAGLML